MLQINQEVLIVGKKFKIMGIDNYTVINSFGKKKKWTSYTLIYKKTKRWLIKGIKNTDILCAPSKKSSLKSAENYKFNFDFSGIAKITFKGNKGFSTPLAEVVLLENQNQVRGFERFFDKKIKTYYYTGEILKSNLV